MDQIIPWRRLSDAIRPHYPVLKGADRRPTGLDRVLRVTFSNIASICLTPAAEEAIYDSLAMRQFGGVDMGNEPAPDEMTILKFRHLMEQHQFGDQLLQLINDYL